MIIPLNIVTTYPVRWTRYKIFRDFVQNFYDSVGYGNWKERFSFEYSNGLLRMWVEDVCFSYEWLLHIGASTKTANSHDNAGYFGEGFKIASLCAVRDYGWQIEMSSGGWELSVMCIEQEIDRSAVWMLAYDVKEREEQKRSCLEITYFDALATYIHETCHVFGGDSSNAFSQGLTVAMETLLANAPMIENYRQQWLMQYRE